MTKIFHIFLSVLIAVPAPVLAQGIDRPTGGDDSTGRKIIDESSKAPNIKIRAPSTEGFFRQGEKAFPKSFQLPDEQFNAQRASSDQVQEEYPVGPGDRFLINFWGNIEDNLIIQINSDHRLFIPRVGVVETKGLIYKDLQEAVTKKLNSALKNVSFTISLYRPRQFSVHVLGAVPSPRPIVANAKMRASEVIAQAGGILPTGSTQFIELRRNGEVRRVDLLRYRSFGDFQFNPFVSESDIIFVGFLRDFVSVAGAVVQTGAFEILEERRLEQVIEQLGGLSIYADRAAPIRVSRRLASGERVQIRVFHEQSQASSGAKTLSNFELQPADEVFVPSSNLLIPSTADAVFVTGEVKTPGARPYQVSMSVEEYIGSAGGLTPRADLGRAEIYKADGSSVRVGPRMAIEPGDTIHIPEKTFKFWQDHLTIITTFISLATSIIVLSGR